MTETKKIHAEQQQRVNEYKAGILKPKPTADKNEGRKE